MVFHPTAGYAYVINELDSTVTAYNYDRATGSLEPKQIVTTLPATFTGENRAAGIGITPSGKFLYASNRGLNQITIFAIDQTTGMLTSAGWEFDTRKDAPLLHARSVRQVPLRRQRGDRHDRRVPHRREERQAGAAGHRGPNRKPRLHRLPDIS